MPKSSSPVSPHQQPKLSPDEQRQQEITIKKKKNADAQAAFRGSLPPAIPFTSLEQVVMQLQDSCREAQAESMDLRREYERLRAEFHEREKLWRALWQAKKSGPGSEVDEMPPPPPTFSPNISSSGAYNNYGPQSLVYRPGDSNSACNPSFNHSAVYAPHSPTVAYTGPSNDIQDADRMLKFSYSQQRDAWTPGIVPSTSSVTSEAPPSHPSPTFTESPIMTSPDVSYVTRFGATGEDQKVPLNTLDTAPYVFSNSRSISPTSTPPSSASSSLTSPFQFTFSPDGTVNNDHPEFEYRRHPNSGDLMHGATAEISLAGPGSEAVRYRLGSRSGEAPHHHPGSSDHGSDEDNTSYSGHRHHTGRRSRADSYAHRSNSDGDSSSPPALSGTLAVIKAQAFGALRRTRVKHKTSDAPKVSIPDVLESRGIGLGPSTGSKRPRLSHDDDFDMPST
ncbi:hypothetical protein FISHEDRAFT_55725 [Fistulina hepatica ATCC 64428]|uniref:BZIP domain-containing protein n=1 Tax=Fistulina hepatica ATCC 64428 TaxID=1128425 RepID=A0A0D7ALL7_9AGAR|nr:hypothetical protein FISHEDRAFT_55725 [Fistulina hepatica ATCC 64428]